MSQLPPGQYPSPYSYPSAYGYDPAESLRGPAKRAGLAMIIVGMLLLVFSMCMGSALILPPEQMESQLNTYNAQAPADRQLTVAQFRKSIVRFMSLLAGSGLPMLILGFPIRKSSGAATIAGSILVGLMAAVLLLLMLITLSLGGGGAAVGSVCVFTVPLAILLMIFVMLIQAWRANGQMNAMAMQYGMGGWVYPPGTNYDPNMNPGYPQPPPPDRPVQ